MASLSMVLPKIECEATSKNYGRYIISPLESGYGVTLGNSLRRVLLSSLPGAAITSVRVSDVHHEFSEIPHVKEDMTQLMLQLKQVRLKLEGEEAVRLRLEVRGEGIVTAADIQCPPEVEIVNPDLYLFTVDSEKARLEMEFTVERGRGYQPADVHGRLPIGELPVDAIFSPVRRCNYTVERARVGQMTNYDKILIDIWTDGTFPPQQALSQSARVLMQHFSLVAGVSEDVLLKEQAPEEPRGIPTEVYDAPIEQLDLSVRVFNSLKRAGVTNVGEVLEMLNRGEEAMLTIRNFGQKSLLELREKLSARGYLKEDDLAGLAASELAGEEEDEE
ncbi:MAG: DNA-directed RNA polymerase subunit alpha [Thermoflexales bacterium]|nr:DNA-directed RNA polymerase subunit alpha [Thermoflexales bacterium]